MITHVTTGSAGRRRTSLSGSPVYRLTGTDEGPRTVLVAT